jgi:hypothetical protein
MHSLPPNDKNFGPFTLARWNKTFSACINGDDGDGHESNILIVAFGWALRVKLPFSIKPFGKYNEHAREYGFRLSDMGNGYDFLQIFFGPQTHDSSTTKSWSKHLPWKQWNHVRHSLYTPTGEHFYTEPKGADFREYFEKKEACPKAHFGFEDYDGELIIATCCVEEREWHKGEGWFKWLKWFSKPKIRRDLDLAFSAEVGPQKGSWKGGTMGHGIDILPNETPIEAFQRYCAKTHERKGREFNLRFIGPCSPPPPKPKQEQNNDDVCNNDLAAQKT